MTRFFRSAWFALAIICSTAGLSHAQAIGSVFGKVTDPSGGVLPGVTVTVTGTGLQQPLVGTTAASGAYQFPSVPIGTYTVTFEMSSFKKAVRSNIVITNGFNAQIDQKLELGQMSEEMTVTAAAPVVDTKKTTTGSVFTAEILQGIPTARDPWQIVAMTPGVQLSGINVGGSASGQQLTPSVYGSSGNVQWNLEGGSTTDLSSNSSASYYNFDSFEQISVVTGGGDVSVQSGGLSINLVTKSGSNVFKGTAVATFENDAMQANNVSRAMFASSSSGFLSGNPLKKIGNYTVEYGGPIKKNQLWWWASAGKQDINVGVINFFDPSLGADCQKLSDAQKAGTLSGLVTYDNLSMIQGCLANDQTTIVDYDWKANYQINSSNKFQYLFTSDNKVRNHRGATATTAPEATQRQYAPAPWGLPYATHSLTHTWIASDKLVFNNQMTYVNGGFSLDYQDYDKCGESNYTGSDSNSAYQRDPTCLWNVQALTNRTTAFQSMALQKSYFTTRHTWEVKSDGTYFLSNVLGGDHSLKFGLGWRKAPVMTFSHYSGGARATQECVGNVTAGCGATTVGPGSATPGVTAYQAVLYRDQLLNNDWWTYNGYVQDGYSRGRLRLNGGLRYDWQQSKYLGGCIPANVIRPDLLPSQCEAETNSDSVKGPIAAFKNWSPRLSATYDLRGNGKTSVHASYSYYFATRLVIADNLGGLFSQPALTWGPNQSSGACSTTAGAGCWQDTNLDGKVQANELIGQPTSSSSRFNSATGVFAPAGNNVDPSTQIGRTRESIVGIQHEVISNLAIGVDYIYRKYDRGTASFTVGYQPGSAGYPLSQIYTGPLFYTDPTTNISAPYFAVCQGCSRPSGLGSIVMTNPNYQVYNGVSLTANKRFSSKWMLNTSLTWQNNPQYFPTGSTNFINPTGQDFQDNSSTLARYIFKLNGLYALPWAINASANLNINDGASRTVTINGPGNTVYGGVSATGAATTISYTTLEYQDRGSTRLGPTSLLDLGLQKVISFRGGRNRLRLNLDAFNVLNVNTILGYTSNNLSLTTFTSPNSIVAPRVFRVGAQIAF